jgi:hypothetical protein
MRHNRDSTFVLKLSGLGEQDNSLGWNPSGPLPGSSNKGENDSDLFPKASGLSNNDNYMG